MDFFGVDFENQQSKDTLKEIVDTISAYDIYDFISRIAGLNLMSENQNKSVLLTYSFTFYENLKNVY